MTDRMRDEQLDSEIRAFLAWQVGDIAGAPTASEMAERISARAGMRARGLRLTPQLVWVVLAGLLILALIGAAVGAMSLRPTLLPPLSKAYEAVFLRLHVLDGTHEVIAVGVDVDGHERQIARLPGAWAAYDIQATDTERGFLAPMGAVSPTGLLALPMDGGGQMMHWEIFDLDHPEAAPIVIAGMEQFIEQLRETPYWKVDPRGGVFWGPGERLANLWYAPGGGEVHLLLSHIDGRTGNATAVAIPAGLVVLPAWASDGSGVFVGNSSAENGSIDVTLRRVLRLDGTVVDAPAALSESSCRTPSGFAFACLAPDDSMIADIIGGTDASQPVARVTAQGSGASFEIEGSFAGWLEVNP
jgi:hypothetical protein